MPAPGSELELFGTTALTPSQFAERFKRIQTETVVNTPVMDQDRRPLHFGGHPPVFEPISELAPIPGEIWSRLMVGKVIPSVAQVDAVLEAGVRCGLQLEPWQAKVLASASTAAMDQLSWPPGGNVLPRERPLKLSHEVRVSANARSGDIARAVSGNGQGRRSG